MAEGRAILLSDGNLPGASPAAPAAGLEAWVGGIPPWRDRRADRMAVSSLPVNAEMVWFSGGRPGRVLLLLTPSFAFPGRAAGVTLFPLCVLMC